MELRHEMTFEVTGGKGSGTVTGKLHVSDRGGANPGTYDLEIDTNRDIASQIEPFCSERGLHAGEIAAGIGQAIGTAPAPRRPKSRK